MSIFSLTNVDRLEATAGELDVPFEMDEEAFRAFYDRTARPLWTYLVRGFAPRTPLHSRRLVRVGVGALR